MQVFLAFDLRHLSQLCFQEEVLKQSFAPLFEMVVERPAHMYGGVGNSTDCKVNSFGFNSVSIQPLNLLQVTPDESTGEDYEQVARKYDSEDEFEIL